MTTRPGFKLSKRAPLDHLERAEESALAYRDLARADARRHLDDYSEDQEEITANQHVHVTVNMPAPTPSQPDIKVETETEVSFGAVKVRGLPRWTLAAGGVVAAVIAALVTRLLG